MAVTSLLTSLENFESAPSYNNIGTGGGASDNNDVFIEGAQSGGRRVDNATDKGFMATISSTDLSGAGEHVRAWVFCFHWSAVTGLTARLRSGTDIYDNHEFGSGAIPVLGGWVPLWVDVSRTPESQGSSGSANEAAIIDIGAYIDIGNVGGAGDNFIIDEIMHGISGYRWDGTGGDFGDFSTYEDTNVEGVFIKHFGAQLCFARLEIGSSTATGFTDSGFTITFPDQPLIAATFMGLTIDLQNASTVVDLSQGAIVSDDPTGAASMPDLLVTGTSGSLVMDTMLLNGLRAIQLNSACSLTNSTILNAGQIDAANAGSNGADLSGTAVLGSTVAADVAAVLWDVNADPDGELDDMTFEKGTAAHHAIEFGSSAPLTMTVRGWTTVGFNASDGNNDSTFLFADRGSDVTWTVNVIGGTGNFSFKKARAGDTVNIVLSPVTTLIKVTDENGADFQNARVIVEAGDGTGDLPFDDTVTITAVTTTATVAHTAHGMTSGDKVVIRGAVEQDYNGVFVISNVSANAYDYTMGGSPSSPATGTIKAAGVVLEGLTDINGEISASAAYSVDQVIVGFSRKATGTPLYKAFPISGTIDKDAGFTLPIRMVRDD